MWDMDVVQVFYFEAFTAEQVYIVACPEFKKRQGQMLVIGMVWYYTVSTLVARNGTNASQQYLREMGLSLR
jgi:hypothetical protein